MKKATKGFFVLSFHFFNYLIKPLLPDNDKFILGNVTYPPQFPCVISHQGVENLNREQNAFTAGKNCMIFKIGQVIHHKLFNYRGVIFGVDKVFSGSVEWYEVVAKSRPPKDKPWYKVLVHNHEHTTYVAERNLEPEENAEAVDHPMLPLYFTGFNNGEYVMGSLN